MKGIAATESSTENDRRKMTEEEETRERRKESPFDMKGRRGNNAEGKGKNRCTEESLQESLAEKNRLQRRITCREESLAEKNRLQRRIACREESLQANGECKLQRGIHVSMPYR